MLNYFKNYKPKNPRATKLGLMATGLSLMKGSGQSYDRPVSTVGLIGDAGLQGLGVHEAAREQDQRGEQKRLEEENRERRHQQAMSSATDISKTEIEARKGVAEYKADAASDLAETRIGAAKSLSEDESERATERAKDQHKRDIILAKLKQGKGITRYQEATLNKWAQELALNEIESLKDPETGMLLNEGTGEPVSREAQLALVESLREKHLRAFLEQETSESYTKESVPELSLKSRAFPDTSFGGTKNIPQTIEKAGVEPSASIDYGKMRRGRFSRSFGDIASKVGRSFGRWPGDR